MAVARLVTLTGDDGVSLSLSSYEERGSYEGWLTDLSGYFGGVGVSADDTQRKLWHGAFPDRALRTKREITVEGTLIFEEEHDRLLADRLISGLLWTGEYGDLTVVTDEIELHCKVRLAGEIGHQYYGTQGIKVQIPLTAADPFLYAPARLYQIFPAGFGEGLVFPLFATKKNPEGTPVLDWGEGTPYTGAFGNTGNATAYPVFTVYGDWPAGFTITESGRSISFGAAVDESSPVVIDTRAGSVHVGGVDHTYQLTSREWIDCPAGMSIQPRIYAHAPSSGWCDVQISDTYI